MTDAKVIPRLASAKPAPDDELTWLPAWRIRDLIATRKISAVEVTEHFLQRIETLNPVLHAFRVVDADGARKQAKSCDAAVAAGAALGPLHGVPMAIKELIAVAGMPYWDPFVGARITAERDSLEVERLRKAGAVIVGTTIGGLTAFEFGNSDTQPQNPWDTQRVCGDSSSGSACALAAAMIPATLVTDGLGSARLPGAYCGLIGMMVTRGRVPRSDRSQMITSALSHSVPLSRDVRDAALILSVLAGPDGRDLYCLPDEPPDYLATLDQGAKGMRLVWTDDFGYASAYAQAESQRIIAAVKRAAEGLRRIGAEVEDTSQRFEDPFGPASAIMSADPGLAIYKKLPQEDVLGIRQTRKRIWETFRHVLAGKDFILSPTVQHIAPTRDAWDTAWKLPSDAAIPIHMATYAAHTAAANLLGWPAISVPAGIVDGMPVGLQIFGPPNSEPRMFQLAQAFLAHQG